MQKRVAVVTGASRGVGKGVALELCQAGFMVYITGRSAADMSYIQGTRRRDPMRSQRRSAGGTHVYANQPGAGPH